MRGGRAPMDAQEKRWRTESDVRALTEAQEIFNDPNRLNDARSLLSEQIMDKEVLLNSTTDITRIGTDGPLVTSRRNRATIGPLVRPDL